MCKVFNIKNKKQEEQYASVLESNARNKNKTPIYGFESFRFVGNVQRILPLIKENKQQVKEFLESLQIADRDEPIELDADDINLEFLTGA